MRVAIVGARRVRQGLGPYLARFCREAGADIVAVLGRTAATAEQAAAEIATAGGHRPAAYASAAAFHDHPGVDALVVSGPHDTHVAHLEAGLARGLHVLCEKPLVWGVADPGGTADRLAADFAARGLHLRVNAQWPWTLETFRALHPEAPRLPRHFRMELPPRLRGLAGMLDSLSHPLSVLAALAPDPDASLRGLAFDGLAPEAERCGVQFTYVAAGHAIQAEVWLDSRPDPERRTRYVLDGYGATRRVDPGSYAMTLEDEGRRIPLADPTPRLVRSFLDAATSGAPARVDAAAVPGMRHLVQILEAAAASLGTDLP